MKSSIAHKIKHRLIPNDDFYTPEKLAKKLIKLVPMDTADIVCDNAYGEGVFYKHFPKNVWKHYCDKRTDFLKWDKKQTWLITNPPYSNLDEWLKHSCEIATKGFAYLLGLHNLTPRRIEMCEEMGFGITKVYLCKVFKWFGISAFIIWQKRRKGIIDYDRIVWR
jgi:hypothetical protein